MKFQTVVGQARGAVPSPSDYELLGECTLVRWWCRKSACSACSIASPSRQSAEPREGWGLILTPCWSFRHSGTVIWDAAAGC